MIEVATMESSAEEIEKTCADICKAQCCRGGPEGLDVVLTKQEVDRLQKFADVRQKELVINKGLDSYSMHLAQGKPCIFLSEETNLCSIHYRRPKACKSYPYKPNVNGCILSGWRKVKKPQIFIGVPRGNAPRSFYFEDNLRRIVEHTRAQGQFVDLCHRAGVRVDNNRNAICRQFLEGRADYLVMLDDDMRFHAQTVEILVHKLELMRREIPEAGIICGLYFQRDKHCMPHFYKRGEDTKSNNEWSIRWEWLTQEVHGFLSKYKDFLTDDPQIIRDEQGSPYVSSAIPIDAGGTGCVVIHREVLEKTPEPWFREMGRNPCEKGSGGGDLAFFVRAKSAGFDTYGDIGVICSHMTSGWVGAETFLRSTQRETILRIGGDEREAEAAPEFDLVVITTDLEKGQKATESIHDARHTILSGGVYELGWAKKVNTGFTAARSKYIFLLNDDTTINDEAVLEMVLLMEEDPTIAAIGPTIPCRSHQQFIAKEPDNIDVPWLLGGCQLIRREALLKIGLMDESFITYACDVDLGFRFRDAGYRCVWAQDIHAYQVVHDPGNLQIWDRDHRVLHEKWTNRGNEINLASISHDWLYELTGSTL